MHGKVSRDWEDLLSWRLRIPRKRVCYRGDKVLNCLSKKTHNVLARGQKPLESHLEVGTLNFEDTQMLQMVQPYKALTLSTKAILFTDSLKTFSHAASAKKIKKGFCYF